jgi:hypothetical protein
MALICLGLSADPRIFREAPAQPEFKESAATILTYREFDNDDFGPLGEILSLLDIVDVFSSV